MTRSWKRVVIPMYSSVFSNQQFNANTKIADIDDFDSLAMLDLSIAVEETFHAVLELEIFTSAIYLKDVVDTALATLGLWHQIGAGPRNRITG